MAGANETVLRTFRTVSASLGVAKPKKQLRISDRFLIGKNKSIRHFQKQC
jgi:hypothetical protein